MYLTHYFSNNLLYYRAKSAWLFFFPEKQIYPCELLSLHHSGEYSWKPCNKWASDGWIRERCGGVGVDTKWFPPPLWICACHRCDVMATRSCDWTVGSGREKKQQRGPNVSVASEIQLEVLSGVFGQKRTFNENVRCCIVLKTTAFDNLIRFRLPYI